MRFAVRWKAPDRHLWWGPLLVNSTVQPSSAPLVDEAGLGIVRDDGSRYSHRGWAIRTPWSARSLVIGFEEGTPIGRALFRLQLRNRRRAMLRRRRRYGAGPMIQGGHGA